MTAYGFTVENWKHAPLPKEDRFKYDEAKGIYVVADGITRDCINGRAASSKSPLSTILLYSRPSLASKAAQTFVNTAVTEYDPDTSNLRDLVDTSNRAIRDLWRKIPKPVDYLVNDLPGCVASLAFQRSELGEDVLNFGYIADSGVLLLDNQFNVKVSTPNEGPKSIEEYAKTDSRLVGMEWDNPETRRMIRGDHRNNPQLDSYGAFTGEETAMNFVKTDEEVVVPGDLLILYTDGLEDVLYKIGESGERTLNGKFVDAYRKERLKGVYDLAQSSVKTEGTMIIKRFG